MAKQTEQVQDAKRCDAQMWDDVLSYGDYTAEEAAALRSVFDEQAVHDAGEYAMYILDDHMDTFDFHHVDEWAGEEVQKRWKALPDAMQEFFAESGTVDDVFRCQVNTGIVMHLTGKPYAEVMAMFHPPESEAQQP